MMPDDVLSSVAAVWLHCMLEPQGPLELRDDRGRLWRARPRGTGFCYERVMQPGAAGVAAADAFGPTTPLLGIRVAAYAPKARPPAYARLTKGADEEPRKGGPCALLRRVGQGSYSQVWLARASGDKLVAVKRARCGLERQLEHEAAVLRSMRHGCVVACEDFYVDVESRACLVLRLAQGTLRDLLAAPVSARATLRTLSDLRAGLNALHAAGWVHLDLSPGNVLIHHDNTAQLADLGVSQREGERLRGLYAGTRKYRAPEVMLGARCADRHIDLWALGVIALEMALRGEQWLRGEDSLQQLKLVLTLLGPPTSEELCALLPGWRPSSDVAVGLQVVDALICTLRARGGIAGLGLLQRLPPGEVLDQAAFELALPLLCYEPARRAAGLRLWPELMRGRRRGPHAPPPASAT